MQATGGFPIDLVLFAMIAAFLVLRLRSILGKRTGFEGAAATALRPVPKPGGKVIDGHADQAAGTARILPDPAGPVGRTLASMRELDRKFDAAQFLDGAEQAFRLIVAAFAAGDRARLRPLLADDAYAAFERVISARESAGETQRTEIRKLEEATIIDASLAGSRAAIVVRFVSQQVSVTLDKAGNMVAGSDSATEIGDVWTFERRLGQSDLTWRLSAARST